MIHLEQMQSVLDALPDPAFILSKSGRYIAVFGGKDARYYHDGKGLVGHSVSEIVTAEKAQWFIAQIEHALQSKRLLIIEYELSNRDVLGLPDKGPDKPIWFEGRVQALDFQVDNEDVVLWVASNISKRHELEIKLRELSDTDQLTGLFNRRRLERELEKNFDAFIKHSIPTTLIMFDLDNLKIINDTHGHLKGDELIAEVSRICLEELRKNDLACRFGGDEFVLSLSNTEPEEARHLAERLHERFIQALACFSVKNCSATVSMGLATLDSNDESYMDVLKRADDALYIAKENGKNRIIPA